MENTRPNYGWAIEDRDGDLWLRIFSTRKKAIEYAEEFFGKDWRTLKRQRKLSIVKAKLVKSDWSW